MSRCLWPEADCIRGQGRFVTLSRCPQNLPDDDYVLIVLWRSAAAASDAFDNMIELGCGRYCRQDHELVELDPILRT